MQHAASLLHHFLSGTFQGTKTSEKGKSTSETTVCLHFLSVLSSVQTNSEIFCARDGQGKKLCQLHFSKPPFEEGSDSIAKITACLVEIREDKSIVRSCHSHQKDGWNTEKDQYERAHHSVTNADLLTCFS